MEEITNELHNQMPLLKVCLASFDSDLACLIQSHEVMLTLNVTPCGCSLQEEPLPLAFFVKGEAEVVTSLASCVKDLKDIETEQILPVMYQPLAVFRVRAVARCTSSLQGHTEAVISTAFSPTGK